MKSGITLKAMAERLQDEQDKKRDFVASTAALNMDADAVLAVNSHGRFSVRPYMHGQISQALNIPKPYYDRMLADAPDLLAANVNRWFRTDPEPRMVRTIGNEARALLSSRFRPLDNFDLAEAVLPILLDDTQLRVESSALTETRMYIKAISARITAEVVPGDVVQAGIVISNSEVGAGSVKIEPLLYRLICANGAIANDFAMKKYHVGKGFGSGGDGAEEFFRDETRVADDRAFFLKVQDLVRAAFDDVKFGRMVDRVRATTQQRIVEDPVKVVEVFATRSRLTDNERGSVLRNLIEGRDLTQYGLLNAVTAAAQDATLNYERATDLERLGGDVIEMKPSDWRTLMADSAAA